MNIKEAIQKAYLGGFNHEYRSSSIEYTKENNGIIDGERIDKFNIYRTVLDKNFWQALGKSMGWEEDLINSHITYEGCSEDITLEWKLQWHKFIDHLADGGTIEGYFKQLK